MIGSRDTGILEETAIRITQILSIVWSIRISGDLGRAQSVCRCIQGYSPGSFCIVRYLIRGRRYDKSSDHNEANGQYADDQTISDSFPECVSDHGIGFRF